MTLIGCLGTYTIVPPPAITANKTLNDSLGIAQPLENIIGKWHGIVSCDGDNMVFDMDISAPISGEISAQFSAQMIRRKTKLGTTKMVGEFVPQTSYFVLKQSTDKPYKFSMNLEGVLDPETGRMTALAFRGGYQAGCGYIIADRVKKINRPKTDVYPIADIIKYVNSSAFQRVPMNLKNTRQECKPNVNKWLSQIHSFDADGQRYTNFAAYDLLSPKRFKPYFGKTFNELSYGEIANLHYQLTQSCKQLVIGSNSGSYMKNSEIIDIAAGVIQNNQGRYRGGFLIYPFARNVLENWRAHAVPLILKPNDEAQFIHYTASRTLTLLWTSHGSNLNRDVLVKTLDSMINSTDNRFLSLHDLAKFLDSHKRNNIPVEIQERILILKNRLNQEIVNATLQFTKKLSTIKDIDHVRTGLEKESRYRYFLTSLNKENIQKVNRILLSAQSDLLKKLVDKEKVDLKKQISKQPNALMQLEIMVQHDAATREKFLSIKHYAATRNKFLPIKHFSTITHYQKTRKESREVSRQKNMQAILQKLNSAKNEDNMKAIYFRYVTLEDDKAQQGSTKIIADAFKKKLAQFRPFINLPGGDYLDAIYKNDYRLMRLLDFKYKQALIGSTNAALVNILGRSTTRSFTSLHDEASLIDSVVATYLFNYATTSARCLRKDSKKFNIHSTLITTTRNGLGDFISRKFGPTNVSHYEVNSEFVKIFQKIYKSNKNSLSIKISGGDPRNGVQKFMGSKAFSCDSEDVKIFEKNLIKLFKKHNKM